MNAVTARRHLDRLALLALAGLAVLTVLAQFGSRGWLPELATHFRVQYLAIALVLALLFGVLRRPMPALAALALLAPHAWYVAPYLWPGEAAVSAAPLDAVRVLSLNLYYRNDRYAEVRDYLLGSDADLLVLSELTPAWVRELQSVTSRYPFWMSLDQRGPWGLGVFSRYPLRDPRSTSLGVAGSVNVRALVELPGGAVDLVAVHLSSPTTPERAAMRNRQLAELARLLGPAPADGAAGPPRMLIGDMNLTPFSPYFSELLARTGLRDARRPAGLLGTWPTWLPPLQITIDQCLVDAALGVAGVTRGPVVGSDHYPLEVTLARSR
jgi:endonuclease/exonuclease/phosphatase (EEP) superfamily protein YafD